MQTSYRAADPPQRDLVGQVSRVADRVIRFRGTPPRIDQADIRRIVIIKPCCLGDMIMATPVIRALDRFYPDARITVVTDRWTRNAIETNPRVDQLIIYPDVPGMRGAIQLANQLRNEQFDLAVSLDRSPLIPIALWLARIPIRAGIDSHSRGIGLGFRVEPLPDHHETDLYLETLYSMGLPEEPAHPEYHVTDEAHRRVAELLPSNSSRPIVVIHPGGAVNPGVSMLEKRWPATSFGELVTLLGNETDALVALAGADSDRDSVETVKEFARLPVLDLCGQLSFDEHAALCHRASLYIGNDSGATHLASAVGAPVVVIFGPTNPNRYRPRGRKVRVCAPEQSWEIEDMGDLRAASTGPRPDIAAVGMPQVFNACLELLNGVQR